MVSNFAEFRPEALQNHKTQISYPDVGNVYRITTLNLVSLPLFSFSALNDAHIYVNMNYTAPNA